MQPRILILVLGYGRSGTSALTRVISLCGCALPDSVFGATDINPTGHWEAVAATKINIDFMSRVGVVSDPTMRLQEMAIPENIREDYIGKIQLFLSTCRQESVVVKEFRINELLEYWVEAARRASFEVKVVVALRHPQEVFASVIAGFHKSTDPERPAAESSIERFNTFWLKTNLLAERNSRSMARVFVEYTNLLKDWRAEVARMSRSLAINMNAKDTAIDSFLKRDLYRHRYSGPITETFGYSWTTRVYAILSAAAQDAAMDLPSLDEIYHAYRASARAFRLSMQTNGSDVGAQQLRSFVEQLPVLNSSSDI